MYIIGGTRTILSYILKYTPVVGQQSQEGFNEEVHSNPRLLKFVPDIFKNQEMCINAVWAAPWVMDYVPPRLKTHEMFSRTIEKYMHPMRDVPDHLKNKRCVKKLLRNTLGS